MDFDDAFEEDYEQFTGHISNILKDLKSAITKDYSNDDDVTWYYVGIASGRKEGCRTRPIVQTAC